MTHLHALLAAILLSAPDPVDERIDHVRSLVDRALEQKGCVALSVAVARGDDELFAGGFGIAELEHGVAADVDTIFRIGSITKQFTAGAILRLVETGEVDLDEDFRTYLRDYPEQSGRVTVRHLLTHTSGIPSYTNQRSWRRTVPLEMDHEELLSFVSDKPLEFSPGARWSYCNTGYYLLGMIIEEVTGQAYGEYLNDVFFEPLDLSRTRYGSIQEVIPNRAQGYRLMDGEVANDQSVGMSQPGGAGALISTARDLVKWNRALVNGEAVSDESYQEMIQPFVLSDGESSGYGFGLAVREQQGHRSISHGGGINGFNSQLSYFPDADLTVAVISSSEAFPASVLAEQISEEMLRRGD